VREEEQKDSSGYVLVNGDIVEWYYQNELAVSFDLNDVIVVGEYTDASGPRFDDWFLVFVTRNDWWRISFFASHIEELTQVLSSKLNTDLSACSLANSTEWKSIIQYPKEREGKALFQLTPTEKIKTPGNFWERVKAAAGLGSFDASQEISISQDVKQYVEAASR